MSCLPQPVTLPNDPYVTVRQVQLLDTDTESDPEEDPSEAEKSQPLETAALSPSSFCKRYRSSYETSSSLSPTLPVRKRYRVVPSPIASPVATPTGTISVDKDQFLKMENHDLRMQHAEERRKRLELADRVDKMERRQESREE
nr:hypothetical protein [Tanacetum cinerariifolium]